MCVFYFLYNLCLKRFSFKQKLREKWSELCSTRSAFVTSLFRRAQSGRWSSFGKRVWFTESHLVFSYYPFTYVLFTQFILDIK